MEEMSQITELEGDLFTAPDNAALIHACNCQGTWGKGIAKGFRDKYPAAYKIYRTYCKSHAGKQTTGIAGTALIIPPQPEDYTPRENATPRANPQNMGMDSSRGETAMGPMSNSTGRKHWIICLMTSWHYSPKLRSSPEVILRNTARALEDMKRQLDELQPPKTEESESAFGDEDKGCKELDRGPSDFWACRFNSGLFGVPWPRTKALLEESGLKVTVIRPTGEPL